MKMQCVLEDRTVVEKDCKLVLVIGEGDVNQVKVFILLVHNFHGSIWEFTAIRIFFESKSKF